MDEPWQNDDVGAVVVPSTCKGDSTVDVDGGPLSESKISVLVFTAFEVTDESPEV